MTAIGVVYRSTGAGTPASFGLRAEQLGYESVWVSEGWGDSAVVLLTEIAAATTEIRLCSAVLNVFSRTPATLSMTAASLQRASDGRFVLGLGTSHPPLVENLHSLAFERPVRRVRETVEVLRALTSGDGAVSYEGEVFEVDGFEPLGRAVPVYNAAMGPANRHLTGTHFDGWVPNQIPLPELETAFETVAEGAASAGRSADEITVSPWVPAAVTEDGAEARDIIRRSIATYVGRFESYRRAVGASHPEVADRVANAFPTDTDAAVAAVPDDLVDRMGVAGTPAEAQSQLAAVTENPLLDQVVLSPPKWAPDRVIDRTVEALAPAGR